MDYPVFLRVWEGDYNPLTSTCWDPVLNNYLHVRHAILAVIPIWVKKCNNAISPGFPVSSAPRAIVVAPRPPATPGRIPCRLVGPKKKSWCRPGPQWSPTRVSSRLLQVALGVKRAGVSGPDGLQNAPRLRVLRTWHLRRA